MKRTQAILLVLVIVALVQMACSLPQAQTPTGTPSGNTTGTPVGLITPTTGPAVITATAGAPTQSVPPTQPAATVVSGNQAPTATKAPSSGNNNSSGGVCTYLATFIADVTIPDDTQVTPGASFTKTWRVRNDGTCTWGPDVALHALAFTGGSKLGGPDQVDLRTRIVPGQTADLSVNLVAPSTPGVYTNEWKFRVDGINWAGPYIGLGTGKVAPLYARIVVGATPTPTTAPDTTTRIEFAAGATNATVQGSVKAGKTRSYVLAAGKGQLMMAGFSSAVTDLRLKIIQASNGSVLVAVDGSNTQTYLPADGDYIVQVIGGSADANFTLGVNIPSRITFDAGSTSASLDGKISAHMPVMYILKAQAGQTMSVKVTSPSNGVALTIYGVDDGSPLIRADFGRTEWSGKLNLTQDYIIMVVPSVDSTTYNLTVSVKSLVYP